MLASKAVKSLPIWLPILLVLALAPAARSAAEDPGDAGAYQVFVGSRALGLEYFSFEPHGDSIMVFSHVRQAIRGDEDSLKKDMAIVASYPDYDLRSYESNQHFRGIHLKRRLALGDTIFVSYLEQNEQGTAETLVRPPGRLYVIDPQLFVLFDVLGRNLHRQSFASRPVSFVVLGQPDTTVEATATDLGTEPIRWGAREVQAHKYRLSDAGAEFLLWTSPQGRLLRLTQPASELRVELQPPKIRPARRRPRAS